MADISAIKLPDGVTYNVKDNEAVTEIGGTSPISVTDNEDGTYDIEHEASGVTAGTYDGGNTKEVGFYVPSFTVDTEGHVTSATDLGNLIPQMGSSSVSTVYGNLISTDYWNSAVRAVSTYGNSYTLSAGETSATFSVYDAHASTSSNRSYFRVVDVTAIDISTGEVVIVDWNTNYAVGTSGKASTITLTVSIAEAYDHSIVIIPTVSYTITGM